MRIVYIQGMDDELRALVLDEETVARDELARALQPYVRFTSGGKLLLEPAFDELPAERRVLCLLLALQAMRILEMRDSDDATPAELTDLSGMAAGTVRPKLAALLKGRRVVKIDGRYSLPLHSARRAMELLGAPK